MIFVFGRTEVFVVVGISQPTQYKFFQDKGVVFKKYEQKINELNVFIAQMSEWGKYVHNLLSLFFAKIPWNQRFH